MNHNEARDLTSRKIIVEQKARVVELLRCALVNIDNIAMGIPKEVAKAQVELALEELEKPCQT